MASIRTLFDANQAGLTVYSPDCTQSRLWGHVDQSIQAKTGYKAIYRQWIHHDYNSIMRFYAEGDEPPPQTDDPEAAARKYDRVPIEQLQYGHLFVKLVLSGPALLTIWQGDDAIAQLLTVKGATHPAKAESGTLRGSLWCDNGICNQVHSSDDLAEALREIEALRLSHILDAEPTEYPIIAPHPSAMPAHSGIITLYQVMRRYLMPLTASSLKPITPPINGDAHQSNQMYTDALTQFAHAEPTAVTGRLINAYLAGDVVETSALLAQMPATQWERFVIQCGAITRKEWGDASST